jgi:hypothetical protein
VKRASVSRRNIRRTVTPDFLKVNASIHGGDVFAVPSALDPSRGFD